MIQVNHLFPILDRQLLELLRSLEPRDWNRATIAKKWTVKDIAAHLLDGNLRVMSMVRDRHSLVPDREIGSYTDLVDYLNQLNADFVTTARRFSPGVIIELLELTGKEYCQQMSQLDPDGDAIFSVAWAGEETSKNWFHVAREYTEKWHHQQQIRDAVGRSGIMTYELFYPVMDTFMHGLPHTYRYTAAETGTVVHVKVDTNIGGDWYLLKTESGWQLTNKSEDHISVSVLFPPDTAWKLFTKGMNPEEALPLIKIGGNEALGKVALELVAVMASR